MPFQRLKGQFSYTSTNCILGVIIHCTYSFRSNPNSLTFPMDMNYTKIYRRHCVGIINYPMCSIVCYYHRLLWFYLRPIASSGGVLVTRYSRKRFPRTFSNLIDLRWRRVSVLLCKNSWGAQQKFLLRIVNLDLKIEFFFLML